MTNKQNALFRCTLTLSSSELHEAGWVNFYVRDRTEPVGEYDLLIDDLNKLVQMKDGPVVEQQLKQALDEQFFTDDEVATLHKYLLSSTCLKDRLPEAQWSPLVIEQFNPPIVEIGVTNDHIVPMSWRNTSKMLDMYQNCDEFFEHIDFMESDPCYSLPFHLVGEVILRYSEYYIEGISNER
jgi:hypothetical protein